VARAPSNNWTRGMVGVRKSVRQAGLLYGDSHQATHGVVIICVI